MLVIGLTGGIGSGKTTAAHLFAKHGVPVIDADAIARDITQPGLPAYDAILSRYSAVILQDNRSLNRDLLRKIIFTDPAERAWLEKLLHPIIRQRMEESIKGLSAPYCIVVIPLLVESGPYPFIDRILVIDTPESKQLERVAVRDQTKSQQVEAILLTQAPRQQRLEAANDVIMNEGTLTELAMRIDLMHQAYLQLAREK